MRSSGSDGSAAAAAARYAAALKVAPPEKQWPPLLKPQLDYARTLGERRSAALAEHLTERLAPLQAALPPALAERWREATAIRAGRSQPYVSESNQMHVPRLPAIPFHDRAEFPALRHLEAHTDAIRGELLAMLETGQSRFSPCIAYKPGDPVNQWQELNHSDRWSAFHFWRGGSPVAEHVQWD